MSPSTACRALNGHPAIKADTVARVRRLAEKLHYQQPRNHRRFDVTQRLVKANIGIVSLGMDRSLLALPILAEAINGVESALSAAGASVQLIQVPDLNQIPAGVERQRLDGVILIGAMQGDGVSRAQVPFIQRLRTLPGVWIVGRPLGCWGDVVSSNDYATGSLAAEYLVARGHRRLAFINPKPDHLLFMRREDGFVATARRLGAEVQTTKPSPDIRWDLPLRPPEAIEAVQGLVDQLLAGRSQPTALFAAADSVAALVYRALTIRRLQVGRDISVISGNNDLALIAGLHPQLTTFEVHAQAIGLQAVRQLALRMASGTPPPESEMMLSPTLVEGGSVATLNARHSTRRS